MTEVFIDSGVFVAFLNRSDQFHQAARALFSQPLPRCSTSVLVVSETYSLLLYRSGEEEVRRFRFFLQTLRNLLLLPADALHQEKVWNKLDLLRGSGLTYVDASSLIWIGERRVKTVWGTDHHLALEGAAVIPGPPAR